MACIDRTSFDVVVIGAGMAGSIVGARCAGAGLDVAIVEAGREVTQDRPVPKGFVAGLLAKLDRGLHPDPDGERWPQMLLMRKSPGEQFREVLPMLGRGPGGSGRIYGAALGRARREDFERDSQPSAWHRNSQDALPNAWPIDFDAFRQWYARAEDLLRVTGSNDPLDPHDDARLLAPPAVCPGVARMADRLRANGRHPFAMHVGIAHRPGCNECQARTCMRDCKSHGYNRALLPALREGALVTMIENTMALRVQRRPDASLEVELRESGGALRSISGRIVVLAGGALNSPLILQRSTDLWNGAVPPMIGTGVMFHSSEIFAISGFRPGELFGPRKVLAFRDHYRDGEMPLGECQSFGIVPSPGLITRFLADRAIDMGLPGGRALLLAMIPAGLLAYRRFANSETFTAALEDLPYAHNRVEIAQGSGGEDHIAITYQVSGEIRARSRRFRSLMREAFAPFRVDFATRPGAPNLGHPMGTCRMGAKPSYSVVDADCRVWGQEGLYVADASVFPSSLGVNPALTVAANAMRVAKVIVDAHARPAMAASDCATANAMTGTP